MLSWHFNHSTILHQSRRVQSFTSLLHRLLFGFIVHTAFCYSLLVFSLCLLLHNTPPRTSVGRPQGCNRRCPISHVSIIGHARSNVCVPCRPVPFHAVPCLNVFKRNIVFHPSTSFKATGTPPVSKIFNIAFCVGCIVNSVFRSEFRIGKNFSDEAVQHVQDKRKSVPFLESTCRE